MTSLRVTLSYEEAQPLIAKEAGHVFFATEPVTHRQHHANEVAAAKAAGAEPPPKPKDVAVRPLHPNDVKVFQKAGDPVPEFDDNDPALEETHHHHVNAIVLPSQGLVVDVVAGTRPTDNEFSAAHPGAMRVTKIG